MGAQVIGGWGLRRHSFRRLQGHCLRGGEHVTLTNLIRCGTYGHVAFDREADFSVRVAAFDPVNRGWYRLISFR